VRAIIFLRFSFYKFSVNQG